MKTGNFTIIAGEKINFIAEEIEIHATKNINNFSSRYIVKNGEKKGRHFDYYKDKKFDDLNIKVEDKVKFKIYHTWVSTQPDTEHIGNDKIVVSETRLITAKENSKVINQERFVTDYYAHINDHGEFDGLAYSTWYYLRQNKFQSIIKTRTVKHHSDETSS